jgi:hypothetical protein
MSYKAPTPGRFDARQNTTDYQHPQETNLLAVERALQYRFGTGEPELRVNLGANSFVISGNVNIPGIVTVASSPENPNHVHLSEVGTSGILTTPWLPVAGNVRLDAGTNLIGNVRITDMPGITVTNFPAFPSNISITSMPAITGHVTVDNFPLFPSNVSITQMPGVSVTNFPSNIRITDMPGITGNVNVNNFPSNVSITQMPAITGTVNIGTMPEVEIKNDAGNAIPVTGNVTATISDVITVIVNEQAGQTFAFNNHALAVHRGWTMDDTMRPVVSVRVTDSGTTVNDIVKIIEYEIGNNNANQSTIVYEWYEGPLTLSGAATPSWTNLGTKIQYRIYQDVYSSNTGNTFTVPAGTYLRHSGIIIGKNSQGDEGPNDLYGGATPNMLTLCMKRVDNGTKLDVWFAFTNKELT